MKNESEDQKKEGLNEEMPLVEKKITPLPTKQIIVVMIATMSEAFNSTLVMPVRSKQDNQTIPHKSQLMKKKIFISKEKKFNSFFS